MAQKFYAVKKGKKPGVYRTWDECKAQVDGFSGASYKSFPTMEAAREFVGQESGTDHRFQAELVAYVDGSYNKATKEFSYGMVLLCGGKELCFSKRVDDKSLALMHNVAGEIKGAQAAMEYAIEHGYSSIEIHHDYEGIAKWCLGEWKTNKEGTIAYKRYYDSIKCKLKVRFVKVKGHSGDKYNDMADELAKSAIF